MFQTRAHTMADNSRLPNSEFQPGYLDKKRFFFILFAALLLLLGLYLRMSGLFRGLGTHEYTFHPDEAKQVVALFNFLHGVYTRYYGNLFYDGYPYGLNHLDEYLLRPLFFFLGNEIPDRESLFIYARLLRVTYGMAIMAIGYTLVQRLLNNRKEGLLAMFFLAIAPLSITVTHFATGDIGVDLFTALCFLFLLFYLDKNCKKTWLLASGIAVGAAFSAKYNGILVGMGPGIVLCLQFLRDKNIWLFVWKCMILLTGVLIGIVIFTPNFLLDFDTTTANLVANFQFIKNYNVPSEILAKPWLEKAFLGLKNNSLYIISSLGYAACLASLSGLFLAGKQYLTHSATQKDHSFSHNIFILSIALLPILTLLISLSGKYMVQPFHFSYLQLPVIVTACFSLSTLYRSGSLLGKLGGLLLLALITIELGSISWKDNFFWRLEDNLLFAKGLPATIYTADSLKKKDKGQIRSLYLEPGGTSVFKNRKHVARGPDANLWKSIEIANLPQVPNPVGRSWIFLNGPSFPRNERMFRVHGWKSGITVKRFLVLPAGNELPLLGFRCGSYATEAVVTFGNATSEIKLDAHQQKIITLKPTKWRSSGEQHNDNNEVHIIPLEITVPHDDVWVTILTTKKERDVFTLFGGGEEGKNFIIPEKIPLELEEQYFHALNRLRYMETSPSWNIKAGERIPMWEVALPAGCYKLTCEVEGLADESIIEIEFKDARGEMHHLQGQSFPIKKGSQRIEYFFSKPFTPYQGHFVIKNLSGNCTMHAFKLFPDQRKIFADLKAWRATGVRPQWVSRVSEKRSH